MEVASSKHLSSLESYYNALSFLLKAYSFFSRQAEYAVVLDKSKLNDEYKRFIVEYMSDCSTKKHLHKQIKEFKIYGNKNATPRQIAFAWIYFRFTIPQPLSKGAFLYNNLRIFTRHVLTILNTVNDKIYYFVIYIPNSAFL